MSISDRSIGDRLAAATDTWWARLALGILLAATMGRLLVSGVLFGIGLGIPANVVQLEPLFELIVDDVKVTSLAFRSYGVVAWLLFDPVIRLFGRNALALNLWALSLSLVALASAFTLTVVRLKVRRRRALVGLVILWCGFLPIVYAVTERMFDLLLLGSLAATFFLYTGSARQRPWSGVAVAAGSLAKFLPLIFLPFFVLRERRAFVYGVVAIFILLLVGQVLYGTLMGLGYPLAVALPTLGAVNTPADPSTTNAVFSFSTWHEGFSPRQLLFKIAGGFHLQNVYVVPSNPALWNIVAYVIEAAFLVYFLYVALRHRYGEGLERRSIEFALGITTLYMVAPTIGHQHLPSMILVYTILAANWLRGAARPPLLLVTLTVLSLVLTGVYLPMQFVGAVLPLDGIMRLLGNETTPIYGSPVGEYDFLGFPGYGAILAWVVVVIVERRTRTTIGPLSSPPTSNV